MRSTPHPAKAVLVARGMSQKEVADRVGVTCHWLGRVLNGHAPGSPELRHRVAECLGLPVADLFADNVDVPSTIEALVRRTRHAQGLTLVVKDPLVLSKLASILAASDE